MPDTTPKLEQTALPAPRGERGVIDVLRFFLARMRESDITRVSASLSFTTTLQIVPALSLLLAILTAFPAFEGLQVKVQDFIFANFMPDTGFAMRDQFTSFIDAAGKLTAFGVLGLAVTSVMLLLTIESSFNQIFKVTRPRRLFLRLLVFWAIITVAPFLVGLSFTLFGYFGAAQLGLGEDVTEFVTVMLGIIVPIVLAWSATTFVYVAVPNHRVLFRDAMIGGAVCALLLAVLRYGFAAFIASMTSYQAMYGALAALPVFLIWVYLTWVAVMAGAVVTASLRDWYYASSGATDDVFTRVGLALDVLAKLVVAQHLGRAVQSRGMAKAFAVPDVLLMKVLDTLRDGRFIALTEDDGWIISRDLDLITLGDLIHQFGLGVDFAQPLVPDGVEHGVIIKRLHHYLARAAESERTILSVTLAKVVAPPDDNEK